jgi:hypothetical protein
VHLLRALLLLVLLGSFLAAEEPAPETSPEPVSSLEAALQGVDRFQEFWSHRMRLFSSNVDRSIATAFSDAPQPTSDDPFFASRWFHRYFVDETWFDPSNRSYIRLEGSYTVGSKSANRSYTDIQAKVMLPRTKRRWQIIIGDESAYADNLSAVAPANEHTGIGLRYLDDMLFNKVQFSASVGISGIDDPYTRLRIGTTWQWDRWMVQPMQTFRYASENGFEEWSTLVVAYRLEGGKGMLQWLSQRFRRPEQVGFEYLSELSYQQINRHRIGIKPYVALFGRTRPHGDYANGVRADAGVYSYAAGVVWKRPVLRDYIFVTLHPGVEFHERFGYASDYRLRAGLEFFIGE